MASRRLQLSRNTGRARLPAQRPGADLGAPQDAFAWLFADSPYCAFTIDRFGAVASANSHARQLFGDIVPGAAAAALYSDWAAEVLHDEALPIARSQGCWRGELETRGADGTAHAVSQTIEYRPAAGHLPEAFLCLAYALDEYDVFGSILRFKLFFEEHPQPMWVYDLESLRFLVVNAAAVRQYGYTEAEFLDMTLRDIRPPEEWDRLARNVADAPPKGPDSSLNWTHVRQDGSRITVEISSHAVTLGGHRARFVLANDVTERLRMADELQLRGRALDASVSAIVITTTGPRGEVIDYANPAFVRLSGYPLLESLGRPLAHMLGLASGSEQYGGDGAALRQAMQSQQEVTLVLQHYHRDGSGQWSQLHVAPVRSGDGSISHRVCVMADMTALINYQIQLEHQANHDALTGLPNRTLFADRLAQSIDDARRSEQGLWVVVIDLDNFKLVNDSQGHQSGDELLRIVTVRLESCLRRGDILARLGGDEFVMLLTGPPDRPVAEMLHNVLETVQTPVNLHGQQFVVSCSVGVSAYPGDGNDSSQLLKQADIAMYRAKDGGRNQLQFYEASMHTRIAERTMIETALRHALARNELSLHYQPKLDMRTGAVIGMEALVRWHSATLGPVSPARFIGVAEETGLIVAIGRWVLRRACAQNQAWQAAGLTPMRVAVNLSARQFRDPNLLGEVRAALADSGLEPQYLELELTESLMMQNVEVAVVAMAGLKQLGIALSIDDFGTGYSSLAYLKLFPIDYLKIDQSFVREMLTQPKVAAIVRSVIALGHSLNFKIVAEGVETEAQLAYLRRYECDEMQGYYFSRPVDADTFAEMLRHERGLPLARPPAARQETLLLLDDEPQVLAALSRLFRADGYQVLTAGTAEQAFDLLALHSVQVVISDQRMPGMTGTEFFSRVKKLYPSTIRLVLSGDADLEAMLHAINRGEIYRFYTKPWEDQALRQHVRDAFDYFHLLHGALSRQAQLTN